MSASPASVHVPWAGLSALLVPEKPATYIYGLADPETGLVRYVGKSVNLPSRYAEHLRAGDRSYRANWIRSLDKRGLVPSLVIIDVVEEGADWQERERYWIAFYRAAGNKLTNGTSGGEGLKDPTLETLRRLSESHKGKVHSEEQRKKMGEGVRRAYQNPELKARLSASQRESWRKRKEAAAAGGLPVRQPLSAEKRVRFAEKLRQKPGRQEQMREVMRAAWTDKREAFMTEKKARAMQQLAQTNTGKSRLPSTVEKMRAHRGERVSVETREKMAVAKRGEEAITRVSG